MQVGLSPLGSLNPFLYATPQAFDDITTGAKLIGCVCVFGGDGGLPATVGWDLITGLGTPNFTALLEAASAAAGVHP